MSDRSFSRRRRGMRFRPSGGLGHGQQHPDRDAIQARSEAVGGPPAPEKVYEHRHAHEIERAENIAAGLPPEGLPKEAVSRVIRMVDRNEYKRRQSPPGVKITPKAFGRDRRLPITNRYNHCNGLK